MSRVDEKASPRQRRRVGVLGTFVWDVIYGRDAREGPVEEWGGITYALSAFDAALDSEWRRAVRNRTSLSLLLVDVDCFKSFNDLYGHPADMDALSAIGDAQGLALMQLQWLGETSQPWQINSEIEGVEGNAPPGGKWFRFQRYDVSLEFEKLRHFGPHYLEADAIRLQQMDRLDIIEEVYDIGYRAAKEQILPEHLFGKPAGA